MIDRKTVLCLGFSQLISWGVTYYLVGGFGALIAADLGWTGDAVYGGFSAALLTMGLVSPFAGRLVDRHGGRRVMVAGSLLNALGCAGLALAHSAPAYYAAWICLGVSMRLSLYDAAFAALARIGGPQARGPISQITLLGGLASTVFWPLGNLLADHLGWRGAVLVYAGFALLTVPLHLAIPEGQYEDVAPDEAISSPRPLAAGRREILFAGSLYALIATLANFLNAGMSSHMIGILTGLGLAASAAVWIATLRGIGQAGARLGEVLFGRRFNPLTLNLVASALLPLCFIAGLFSGQAGIAALAFAFFYGAGNGILTITRGTLPLILFDHGAYGTFVGRLITPSFILSAAAPTIYAFVIGRFGEAGALLLSIGVAFVTLAAAAALKIRFS
ncbi:MFS transporter [Methylocapsa sp. S129]|uniref:MFS transporter n=1 Tax=Methylocapsa sp. S129 TaxID=1641869 RepID=UPI00131D6735|nr:MFS transporter [Methylocapsa sp. S129]